KDTFVSIKHAGSREQIKLFALKNWANGVFAKLPFFGQTVADTIAQRAFGLLPQQLPERMLKFRDRFEHHLLLVVSGEEKDRMGAFLDDFFAEAGHEGDCFVCTDDEAQSAMLHRFGAASAATRYFNLNRDESADMITFGVALRRDEDDWLEVLPDEIAGQLHVSSYYGQFFCHVLHQDHLAEKGVGPVALKNEMTELLEAGGAGLPADHTYGTPSARVATWGRDPVALKTQMMQPPAARGPAVPADHNYGRLYRVPEEMEAPSKELDPCNVFNPGVGETSPRKNWA